VAGGCKNRSDTSGIMRSFATARRKNGSADGGNELIGVSLTLIYDSLGDIIAFFLQGNEIFLPFPNPKNFFIFFKNILDSRTNMMYTYIHQIQITD
jgi:hypothetical protein